MYGAPTQALTDAVEQYWSNYQIQALPFQEKVAQPIVECTKTQLTRLNTHYGIKVQKNTDEPQYYLSPPCVTGFTGGTDASKFISHRYELDFAVLADDEEVGANKTSTNDYIRFYFGDATSENFGGTWGHMNRYKSNNNENLDNTFLYSLEFNNEYIVLRYWDVDGTVNDYVKSMKAGSTYRWIAIQDC